MVKWHASIRYEGVFPEAGLHQGKTIREVIGKNK